MFLLVRARNQEEIDMLRYLHFGLAFATACAAQNESGTTTGTLGGKADGTSSEAYYAVARDTRLCAFPACGGYFVRELNRDSSTCVDGTTASACYVAVIDAAGFAETTVHSAALVRGVLQLGEIPNLATPVAELAATELWSLAGGAVATDGFLRVAADWSSCMPFHVEQLNAPGASDAVTLDGDDATVVAQAEIDLAAGNAIVIAGASDGAIVRIDALYESVAP
jgi:hypothetical protein